MIDPLRDALRSIENSIDRVRATPTTLDSERVCQGQSIGLMRATTTSLRLAISELETLEYLLEHRLEGSSHD